MPAERTHPDLPTVRAVLVGQRLRSVGVVEAVTGVRANPYSSRMSSIILSVETADAGPIRLLAKLGRIGERTRQGSPWGSGYEALIYRQVLSASQSYPSPYLGDAVVGDHVWLFVRWLEGAVRVNQHPDPRSMPAAAAWLGRFHAEASRSLDRGIRSIANGYSEGVIAGWAQLARSNIQRSEVGGLNDESLIQDWVPVVEALLRTEETFVHGDFFPSNVLVVGSQTVPIDWEWAGVAAGEIDLAALVTGWPEATVLGCVAEYCKARWPGMSSEDSAARLWAARFYFAIRALGRRSLQPCDSNLEKYMRVVDLAVNHIEAANRESVRPAERAARRRYLDLGGGNYDV